MESEPRSQVSSQEGTDNVQGVGHDGLIVVIDRRHQLSGIPVELAKSEQSLDVYEGENLVNNLRG